MKLKFIDDIEDKSNFQSLILFEKNVYIFSINLKKVVIVLNFVVLNGNLVSETIAALISKYWGP